MVAALGQPLASHPGLISGAEVKRDRSPSLRLVYSLTGLSLVRCSAARAPYPHSPPAATVFAQESPLPLDLTVPVTVLAGTLIGEIRGGGRPGMENVASVIMQRVIDGWQANVIAVCLAHAQFSCWSDKNRAIIENAQHTMPVVWGVAMDVAEEAMGGTLTNRVNGADSYYALSMPHPPYWAVAPARHTYSDKWHAFWSIKHAKPVAPNVSIASEFTIT